MLETKGKEIPRIAGHPKKTIVKMLIYFLLIYLIKLAFLFCSLRHCFYSAVDGTSSGKDTSWYFKVRSVEEKGERYVGFSPVLPHFKYELHIVPNRFLLKYFSSLKFSAFPPKSTPPPRRDSVGARVSGQAPASHGSLVWAEPLLPRPSPCTGPSVPSASAF